MYLIAPSPLQRHRRNHQPLCGPSSVKQLRSPLQTPTSPQRAASEHPSLRTAGEVTWQQPSPCHSQTRSLPPTPWRFSKTSVFLANGSWVRLELQLSEHPWSPARLTGAGDPTLLRTTPVSIACNEDRNRLGPLTLFGLWFP